MQRPNFAIDAIGDSDGEEEGEDDTGVLDEVEAFLKAHGDDDEGLKGEQKKAAAGQWSKAGSTSCKLTPPRSADSWTREHQGEK